MSHHGSAKVVNHALYSFKFSSTSRLKRLWLKRPVFINADKKKDNVFMELRFSPNLLVIENVRINNNGA